MRKQRNPVARALRQPRFRPRIVRKAKGTGSYNRLKDRRIVEKHDGDPRPRQLVFGIR